MSRFIYVALIVATYVANLLCKLQYVTTTDGVDLFGGVDIFTIVKMTEGFAAVFSMKNRIYIIEAVCVFLCVDLIECVCMCVLREGDCVYFLSVSYPCCLLLSPNQCLCSCTYCTIFVVNFIFVFSSASPCQ